MLQYFYLHGFASGVNSKKAQYFKSKFAEKGYQLQILDLNLGDFSTLQVSKVIQFVEGVIGNKPSVLIGSSLGGLISLIIAERSVCIQQLILLAPALEINALWQQILGEENLMQWEQEKKFSIKHIGYNQNIDLHYGFIQDLKSQPDRGFIQNLPALIFHGINDSTIPVSVSQTYAVLNKLSQLHILDSDHSLENSLEFIWAESSKFLFDKTNGGCDAN